MLAVFLTTAKVMGHRSSEPSAIAGFSQPTASPGLSLCPGRQDPHALGR